VIDYFTGLFNQLIFKHEPILTDFLDPGKRAILRTIVGNDAFVQEYGGYSNAEKKRVYLSEEWLNLRPSDYQIQPYEIEYPQKFTKINHSVILGTLANSGIDTFLSNLGVTLLMFLSGMEINFDLLQRKNNPKAKSQAGKTVDPLPTALTAFAGIVIMAFILAYVLKLISLFSNIVLAAIIFMTVALGVVIATLKEKDILGRPIGQTVLLTAVLGEVIPLLLLTIYAS